MYTFVLGPLVWLSFTVFILGTGFQVFRFFKLSRKAAPATHVPLSNLIKNTRKRSFHESISGLFEKAGRTVLGVDPAVIIVSTVFHVFLLIIPLFLLGHNILIESALGVSLPSMRESTTDFLTGAYLLCCVFFLLRRIFVARVRALTSPYDYFVLALAIVPFASGFLAFHQIFDYDTVILIHMLSGEFLLMAIPFTKLTHMIFFFMNRFMIINEHTIGRGSRVW